MGTLTTGFALAWLTVTAYVAWLGAQQRRLNHRLNRLAETDRQASGGREPADSGGIRGIPLHPGAAPHRSRAA